VGAEPVETATSALDVMDAGELRAFAERYLQAWNSRDPAAVGACVTEDVLWEDPALAEPARGRSEVEAFAERSSTAFPDYEFFELASPAASEDGLTVYAPWRMTGTNTGPIDPPGFAPTGRRIDIEGIDRWQFRDGLIARYRAFYDFSELARQLGLMPPRGGNFERLGARAQRLAAKVRR
jgi:steroid delta-isomerase-like uncharacterized protein